MLLDIVSYSYGILKVFSDQMMIVLAKEIILIEPAAHT